jgi:hypothetical protein
MNQQLLTSGNSEKTAPAEVFAVDQLCIAEQ